MLPSIAKHAQSHGIFPKKSLGQNFIYDLSLCTKIANYAKISLNDIILEIGPGTGGLTRSILSLNPQKLIVLEKDRRCIELLSDIKALHNNLEILEADALKITLGELKEKFDLPRDTKFKIIANLPYNIATQLIINWLSESENLDSITVMAQKEVAQRIVGKISTKTYGRLSIFCQLTSDPKILFDVSPESFYPKPKIWSSVISLIPKIEMPNKDQLELLSNITHDAFGMRRKMLKTSMKSFSSSIDPEDPMLSLRAENLTPEEYLELVKRLG